MTAKLFFVVLSLAQIAQQPIPIRDGQTIPLWAGAAPGALGTDETDIPAITVYLPRTLAPNTPAVIVCPGGGYVSLAMNHEGRQVASYLNSLGIAAFVLRYRLGPRYHHPIELGDAQRAIRLLRSRAAEWRLDPARIGIMGFSAGAISPSAREHASMTVSRMQRTRSNTWEAGRISSSWATRRVDDRTLDRIRDRKQIFWETIQIRNWRRACLANLPLRRARRQLSSFRRTPIRRCRRKTASTTTWRSAKRECPPNCMSLKKARMASARQR